MSTTNKQKKMQNNLPLYLIYSNKKPTLSYFVDDYQNDNDNTNNQNSVKYFNIIFRIRKKQKELFLIFLR